MLIVLAQSATSHEALEQTFGGRIYEGLLLMGVGMLVVFTALLVIGELIGLLSRLMKRAPEEAVNPAPPRVREAEALAPTPAAAAPLTSPGEVAAGAGRLDPRLVAVLAAAATVAVGGPVRVRRVTRVIQGVTSSAWAEAGRLGLQTSHNVRR